MRPDQHKKKKNSEYKKKHGIPSGKGEKHDKKGSTSRLRSDENPKSDACHTSKTGHETDGPNVDDESNSYESRNFSRRKVESNWERYREDFDNESEPNSCLSALNSVPIGADFQSLLDKATSGGVHFQFKSEKEWENLNTDEASKDGPSLLSIDCNALAESLRNISLERRLDIDKKYSFEDKNRNLTANRIQSDKPMENRQAPDQKTTINNNEKTQPTVLQPDKTTKAGNEKEEDDKCHMVNKLKSHEQPSQNSSNSEGKREGPKTGKQKVQITKSDAEEDLELLSETESGKLSSTETQASQVRSHTNEMDFTIQQKPAKDTKEDLEDWLDSILD